MKKYIVFILGLMLLMSKMLSAQTWQQIFPDPLLQEYITEALDSNSDLRIAQLALEQSEAMMKSAKLTYLPNFSFAPSAYVSKAQSAPSAFTYELPITMNWELNFGGKQHHQKEMAKLQLQKDAEQLKYAQIQIIAELANAYYTLIMLDKQYAVTLEGIEIQKENLRVLRALQEVGQQSEAAVNQAEASYQGVVASLAILEAQILKAETAICLILNRTPEHIRRTSFEEAKGIIMNVERPIPLETLASRPDVLAAEYELRSSFSNVKVARSEFYPTFTISGSAGWTNNIGEIINPAQLLLNAIGTLVQPLFAMQGCCIRSSLSAPALPAHSRQLRHLPAADS